MRELAICSQSQRTVRLCVTCFFVQKAKDYYSS